MDGDAVGMDILYVGKSCLGFPLVFAGEEKAGKAEAKHELSDAFQGEGGYFCFSLFFRVHSLRGYFAILKS